MLVLKDQWGYLDWMDCRVKRGKMEYQDAQV
jgi:hypothetical protein